MVRPIEAIYENGCLKLLKKIYLPEHIKVRIAILDEELSSMDIAKLAEEGRAFDFWNNPEEDIYNLSDTLSRLRPHRTASGQQAPRPYSQHKRSARTKHQ